jgi:pyruvate formate lyase activating enzyme
MDLFFENPITRRDFLKNSALLALSGLFLGKTVKFSSAQTIGLIQPYPALHYKKLDKKNIKCTLCPRECVVPNNKRGFCRTRENRDGTYYSLVHSNPCAVHIDPIEKKPLFHFLPGTTALSIATAGCNFTCKNCQNWDISQSSPDQTANLKLSPEQLVDLALDYKTPTIAYTYTEPTVFYEYMLDTAVIAKKKGIYNIYHSNGYINDAPLKALVPYLDGANIDLKAMSNEFYKDITGGTLDPVLNTLKTLKRQGVWLEITNLIIPTKNDAGSMIEDLCQWVKDNLGEDTPVHFSRFYPQYKLQNIPPTPIEVLKNAADIGRRTGLQYIYIGNVPGLPEENTYCPVCNKLIIKRKGYQINALDIDKGRCKFCKTKISGHW